MTNQKPSFYDVDGEITPIQTGYVKSLLVLADKQFEGITSKVPLTIFTKETEGRNYYVESIEKTFSELGLPVMVSTFNDSLSLEALVGTINNTIGTYVYARTDESKEVMNIISTFTKRQGDIDGISYEALNNHFTPAVVNATLKIIEHFNSPLNLEGKTVLIVNRSAYVGQPLHNVLTSTGATTIMCNSTTPKEVITSLIEDHKVDIVIWATGNQGIGDDFKYDEKQLIIDLAQGDITEPKEVGTFCKVTGRLTCLALAENYAKSLPNEPLTQQQN